MGFPDVTQAAIQGDRVDVEAGSSLHVEPVHPYRY
jgi:hypothetical protein